MRKPDTIEHLYLDFDSFFASCEQQRRPELRGRPVGITPTTGDDGMGSGGVIAASREAKAAGMRSVLSQRDALRICPDMAFVPQDPAYYREMHHCAQASIKRILPIEKVMSIDELSCRLGPEHIRDPLGCATRIKAELAAGIGPFITASIGFAANGHLAKMACKEDKPDGATVWRPEDLPDAMTHIPLTGIPGIGEGMERRLSQAGITDMADLLGTSPKQLRRIWGSVAGERFWQAIQGYEVITQKSKRGMIGHGRVLPATWRGLSEPYGCARMLLTKAARRLRREGFVANTLYVSLKIRLRPGAEPRGWADTTDLHGAHDDRTCLKGLDRIWQPLAEKAANVPFINIAHIMVSFSGLERAEDRQYDFWTSRDPERRRWERVTEIIDHVNLAANRSMITVGPWTPPPGGNAGGKIAFTRVPEAEDFWEDAPRRAEPA
ncbi:type VI secretion protein ImpB [uncultured Algimonas sp.]|uniref:Y-family DNA polymerase n=1 Tax=uncultured Algimonas sp. TaxID=1547920 RepID=UPI002616ED74|nr:type VI secretion protein ImpB [uncultured Algimonas sp.]